MRISSRKFRAVVGPGLLAFGIREVGEQKQKWDRATIMEHCVREPVSWNLVGVFREYSSL
jgi:hypothetical protein